MPTNCVFKLNKLNATYFCGETITGTVNLCTTSDKSVKDVSIILLGEGRVEWDDSLAAHEIYINNSTVVWGEGVLPAGSHIYTFAIHLPLECPASLEEKYGHIRYELSIKLRRSLRFDNVFKKPLIILRTIDLNLNPAFRVPLVLEQNGEISYTLKTPYGAYAPGQLLKYSLLVANQTTFDVIGYGFEFKKKVTFNPKSPSRLRKETKEVLVRNYFNETCPRLTNRLLEGQFVVPDTSPTTSSIMCVEYKLKLTVTTSDWSRKDELKIPIIIGTIPVTEILPTLQSMPFNQKVIAPTAPELPMKNTNEDTNNDMPSSYEDSKPPSFEEATRSS